MIEEMSNSDCPPLAMDVHPLWEEQQLILNQIDHVIALFNAYHHLVLFNQKLATIWGLSADFLSQNLSLETLCLKIAAQG